MALVQKQLTNNKRTKVLVAVLVVLGIAALVVSGVGNISWPFSKQTVVEDMTAGNLTLEGSDLPVYSDLGVKVLDDVRLSQLELHGVFPITPGQPGRSNPFVQSVPKP